jgi:hypothetical protein
MVEKKWMWWGRLKEMLLLDEEEKQTVLEWMKEVLG